MNKLFKKLLSVEKCHRCGSIVDSEEINSFNRYDSFSEKNETMHICDSCVRYKEQKDKEKSKDIMFDVAEDDIRKSLEKNVKGVSYKLAERIYKHLKEIDLA